MANWLRSSVIYGTQSHLTRLPLWQSQTSTHSDHGSTNAGRSLIRLPAPPKASTAAERTRTHTRRVSRGPWRGGKLPPVKAELALSSTPPPCKQQREPKGSGRGQRGRRVPSPLRMAPWGCGRVGSAWRTAHSLGHRPREAEPPGQASIKQAALLASGAPCAKGEEALGAQGSRLRPPRSS